MNILKSKIMDLRIVLLVTNAILSIVSSILGFYSRDIKDKMDWFFLALLGAIIVLMTLLK